MRLRLCITALVATSVLARVELHQLETVYEWKYIDYNWPSEAERQEALKNGSYNISRPMPMDVDISQDGRAFVSFLNYPGVPARLGVITNQMGPSGPLIEPYPNWGWTNRDSCDSIIEVYRMEIDKCNRLWVVDSATIKEGELRECHPKLLAFDLWTDELVEKVIIPENIAANARTNESLMVNVRVETYGEKCEDTTVYMADGSGNGLIIWDGKILKRLESPEFNPQPDAENVTIGSETATIPVGIVGMAISPAVFPNEARSLYFRPIASFDMFSAETKELKSRSKGEPINISGVHDVLSSQTLGHAFSSEGTLFMGLTKEIAIACWNRYKAMTRDNIVIVAQDSERLQYANGIKVIFNKTSSEEELLAITNGYIHNSLYDQMNPDQVNFRVLKSPVKSLIAGTKCEMTTGTTKTP